MTYSNELTVRNLCIMLNGDNGITLKTLRDRQKK